LREATLTAVEEKARSGAGGDVRVVGDAEGDGFEGGVGGGVGGGMETVDESPEVLQEAADLDWEGEGGEGGEDVAFLTHTPALHHGSPDGINGSNGSGAGRVEHKRNPENAPSPVRSAGTVRTVGSEQVGRSGGGGGGGGGEREVQRSPTRAGTSLSHVHSGDTPKPQTLNSKP
jgi:hypothetical protein